MNIKIPYGKEYFSLKLNDDIRVNVVGCRLDTYKAEYSQEELVKRALDDPIGSKKLSDLSRGKKKVVIIASDHTRPVPSRIIMPLMLEEIRKGNPEAEITILIATGCHRATTRDELISKFGEYIVENERIVVHDCADDRQLAEIGTLPSGGILKINRLAAEADLLVSEGFIEPHFFAGFSGGRKSVLPGIASRETVYWNHNSEFIHDEKSRAGILDGNPIHRDMIFAARAAHLDFICNVVINSNHEIIGAFSGDVGAAHTAGCDFLRSLCESSQTPADIVITTNNGYPLDQNLYQAVKGMSTAEAVCKDGGTIIICAACEDGIGGEAFARHFMNEKSPGQILEEFEKVEKKDTPADQWQSQIFARILVSHKIIAVTKLDDEIIRKMKMIPTHSIEEALDIAGFDRNNPGEKTLTVIPQGISAIITKRT
ncbi:MAG: nickel-dependent lactate racemase [Lachnospiraceae bacterium]|nr:nickel-dependent lactate racemase [Lachnospiraceae bacterium]